MMNIELVNNPVIKLTMVFEFLRADRVRDFLNGVRLTMCEIVHWLNTPCGSRAVMVRFQDAVENWITHIEIT